MSGEVIKTGPKLFDGLPGPGRPKGLQNKTTVAMKEAIMSVYDALQEGKPEPHGHFLEWAKGEPTEFYKLAAKLIPVQLGGDDGSPIRIAVDVVYRDA